MTPRAAELDVQGKRDRVVLSVHGRRGSHEREDQIYLSYHGTISAKEFLKNFGPDERFLYQRKEGAIPKRMIRAYQVTVDGKPGPWLAGMTLDPAAVSEAWCHQRGYVCFIQELHGRKVKAGDKFGAAYVVGYFDDLAAMEQTYDRYRGTGAIAIEGHAFQLLASRK